MVYITNKIKFQNENVIGTKSVKSHTAQCFARRYWLEFKYALVVSSLVFFVEKILNIQNKSNIDTRWLDKNQQNKTKQKLNNMQDNMRSQTHLRRIIVVSFFSINMVRSRKKIFNELLFPLTRQMCNLISVV